LVNSIPRPGNKPWFVDKQINLPGRSIPAFRTDIDDPIKKLKHGLRRTRH
jgi:hypothetical protein